MSLAVEAGEPEGPLKLALKMLNGATAQPVLFVRSLNTDTLSHELSVLISGPSPPPKATDDVARTKTPKIRILLLIILMLPGWAKHSRDAGGLSV